MYPTNSAFSPDIPTLQLAWDSTSLGLFKECPRKYQYSMIEGWSSRAESIHLVFGQIYHSSLEAYDRARSAGADHETATLLALHHCMKASWREGRPWTTDDPYKNRLTLVRSVLWYLFQFESDPITTITLANGKPAVELSFRVELGHIAPTGAKYMLCGHLDRVGNFEDQIYICDRKTTKSMLSPDFFSKYSPDNQMQIYDLGGTLAYAIEPKGIIIDGAQILVNGTRFQRGLVNYSPSQRDEYYYELGVWFSIAATYAEANFWPKNEKACGNYGGCAFRSVCSKPPGIRQNWLDAGFYKRTWDPLISREV